MDGYSSYTLYVMVVSKIFFGVSVIILLLKKRSGSLEKLAMPWNSSCFADFNMDGYSSLL